MKRIKALFRINPIIVKELRSRMRGPRAFLTLTISLVVTGGILYGLLQVLIAMSEFSSDILSPRIGQALLMALAFLELVIVCAVTPAVTAGAISGEREKQTYDMLQATPLSPARLLWGKLIAALGYVFLLLFAAVPLASLVFIFGGVALRDLLKALLVLLVLTGSFGVLGLFMSALFKRTGRATVASFIVVAILVFVPLALTISIGLIRQSDANIPRWLLAISPVSMLMSTMDIASGGYGSLIFQIIPFFGGYWMNSAMTPVSMTGIPRPLYHYGIPFYLGLALVLYLLASRLVVPGRRWRMKPREWAVGAALILAFAGGTAGLYLLTADRYEWVKAPVAQSVDVLTAPAIPVPAVIETAVVEVTVNPDGATPAATISATPTPVQEGGGVGFLTPTPTPVQEGGGVNTIPFTPEPQASLFFEQPAVAGEIFAAVARNLLVVDQKLVPPPVIYILDKTDDGAGDPSAVANASPLPEEVKAEITRRLSDLNIPVQFVSSRDELIVNVKSHEVKDGGAVISLGNIRSGENGSVKVPASIYWSGKAARGDVYLVSQQSGLWVVTGGTAEWIS